jgi:hypothetical protein
MGTARSRYPKGWRLAAFLSGLVAIFVGGFVANDVLDLSPGRTMVATYGVAVLVVALLAVWLNPRPRRSAQPAMPASASRRAM